MNRFQRNYKDPWRYIWRKAERVKGFEALLSSFYFQHKGADIDSDDASYEFSHKSFGEYLMAKHVVRFLKEYSEIYQSSNPLTGGDPDMILQKWRKQFNKNYFEADLIPYILRELALEKEKKMKKRYYNGRKMFLIGLIICKKMDRIIVVKKKYYAQILAEWCCFEISLITLLSSLASTNKLHFEVQSWNGWKMINQELEFIGYYAYSRALYFWISKFSFYWSYQGKSIFEIRFLSWIVIRGADLSGTDLSGADLTGANLTGADLTGADLTGANLTRVDLTDSKLTRADLRGANLKEADLSGADLKRSRFY